MLEGLKNIWEKTVGGKKEVEQAGNYSAEVASDPKKRATLIVLGDLSGSMSEKYGAADFSKADALTFAVNKATQNLLAINTVGEKIKDRYEVAIIGYNEPSQGVYRVKSILPGELAKKELATLNELYDNSLNPGEDEEMWIQPYSEGGTPMCAALKMAYDITKKVCKDKPKAYPPIVLNFTDGEATDGDISSPAEELKKLKTDDGNVLLFNCHISSAEGEPILFPDNIEQLPDQYARLLFECSSYIPASMSVLAEKAGYQLTENSKGFIFNAQVADVFKFIDIGTRTGTTLR